MSEFLQSILGEQIAFFPFATSCGVLSKSSSGSVSVLALAGDTKRRFWWASLTKPLFAYSVLRAVEENFLALDDCIEDLVGCKLEWVKPATATAVNTRKTPSAILLNDGSVASSNNESLTAVTKNGGAGVTVRHLLAHAGGLLGDTPRSVAEALPAGEFEVAGLQAAPGTKRIYSNAGFELLGAAVEMCTGATASQWLDYAVLQPLGMKDTRLEYSEAASVAKDAVGPLTDLLIFARELLAPQIISPHLFAQATSVAFENLDGVVPGFGMQRPNDWGIGFEIHAMKDPHWMPKSAGPRVFGHFGMSGSFLWVDRDLPGAVVFLGAENFSPLHKERWPIMNEKIWEGLR